MKNHLYHCVLALMGLLLLAGGCSKSSSPTSPNVPGNNVPGNPPLTIVVTASSDTLLVGNRETFKATATALDGSVTTVTNGRWSSRDSAIATVDPATGLVTAKMGGSTVISVDYLGQSGSLKILCLPNAQGKWDGSYLFESCDSSGDFSAANWCNNFSPGKVFPLHLELTQDLETVTGRARFGSFSADVRGVVYDKATLRLDGEVSYKSSAIEIASTFEETPYGIEGTMLWICRSSQMSGGCEIRATLHDMTHAR